MVLFFSDVMGAMLAGKKWVFVWVNFMSVVFMAVFPIAILWPHPALTWAAVGMAVGVAPNVPLLLKYRGVGVVMSVVHFPGFVPLAAYLWWTLLGPNELAAGGPSFLVPFLWLFTVTLSLCILLDIPEAVKWFKGDRAIQRSAKTEARLAADG